MLKKAKSLMITSAIVVSSFFPFTSALTVNASDKEMDKAEMVAPEGVSVENQSVAGMNASEISSIIADEIKKNDDTVFTLSVEDETMNTKVSSFSLVPYNENIADFVAGYGHKGNIIERHKALSDVETKKGKDFKIACTVDEAKTEKYLQENTPELESSPVDNTVVREDGHFVFVEGKAGTVVDYAASAKKIAEFVSDSWTGEEATIDLEVIKKEPRGSKEELEAIGDLLGTCSTDFSSSSSARAGNVRNGTSKLDKSVIYPGEEFSVSTNLEERNAENGYLPAPSYENGTTVDTYGGGVCQISTTLYNAVIRSELEIIERHPHSMIVSYVKPSMDAAISEGSKDFVFKNNKNYPIYIEGYTSGGTLYFNVFGKEERPSNRTVTYESEVLSTTDPGEKFVADGAIPIGTISREQSAHVGHTAQLWKIVTENGKEVSRDVFNKSSYRASDAIYRVGVAGDPGVAASITAAVSSQDRATIEAAVGSAGAPVVTPSAPDPAVTPEPTDVPAPEPTPPEPVPGT